MNDKLFMKVLFGIICVFLATFLCLSIYFCAKGVLGAGLLGLGIFFIGLGITGMLSNGVIFNKNGQNIVQNAVATKGEQAPVKAVTADDIDYTLSVQAKVSRKGTKKESDEATVYVGEDKLYIGGLYASLVSIDYDDVSEYEAGRDSIDMSCGFMLAGDEHEGGFVISASPIRIKGLDKALQSHVAEVE